MGDRVPTFGGLGGDNKVRIVRLASPVLGGVFDGALRSERKWDAGTRPSTPGRCRRKGSVCAPRRGTDTPADWNPCPDWSWRPPLLLCRRAPGNGPWHTRLGYLAPLGRATSAAATGALAPQCAARAFQDVLAWRRADTPSSLGAPLDVRDATVPRTVVGSSGATGSPDLPPHVGRQPPASNTLGRVAMSSSPACTERTSASPGKLWKVDGASSTGQRHAWGSSRKTSRTSAPRGWGGPSLAICGEDRLEGAGWATRRPASRWVAGRERVGGLATGASTATPSRSGVFRVRGGA
jgi:hypothetical protein